MINSIISNITKVLDDELFVVMDNGLITKTNMNINNLTINKDCSFVLIHNITANCIIDITINSDCHVKIKELFICDYPVSVTKNITTLKNSQLEIVSVENNTHDIKINAKTRLLANSYINNMKLSIYRGNTVVNDESILDGDKSFLENYNVYINSSDCCQIINSKVTHSYLDSKSIMTNFGICKNNSILNINTNGIISKGAKRTEIRQKSKGILLDNQAVISANPWLQIDEFDCLASHGAGIGAIDEEELYYLMSRGLSRLESEKLIITGFVNPIYEKLESEKLIRLVQELTDKNL